MIKPQLLRKSIIFSRIFTAKLYLELISVCLFSILVYIIPLWRDNSSVYWLCFSNTLVNIFLPIWYFQGIQKMKIITIIQLILKIVSLPFIFSYVKESSDILIYTIISSTVSIIGSFISFVYIIKVDRVKLSIVPIKQVVESFLQASYFFYSNLGNTIKLQSLNLIIGSHFSMSDLAIYDLAQKIISIPTIILMNVNRAIFPKIMRDTFDIDKIVNQLKKIKDKLDKNTIILSIAAGVSIDFIEKNIGSDKKVVRTMPNTPAQVMQGMTAVSFNSNIEENEKNVVFKLLNSFGKSIEIDEKLMHVYTGISGSLPAYVYVFIEALADGGVLEGMPRDKAYKIIAQAVLGSAKMMLETKKHPGILKDEVTSPGGTTIAALKVLEDGKFRGTVMEAVKACTEKSKDMAQK